MALNLAATRPVAPTNVPNTTGVNDDFAQQLEGFDRGFRMFSERNRARDLEAKRKAQVVQKGFLDIKAQELEINSKFNEEQNKKKREVSDSLKFDQLSDDWTTLSATPGQMNIGNLSQLQLNAAALLDSPQYGKGAAEMLTSINGKMTLVNGDEMFKNEQAFEVAALNGEGWADEAEIPEDTKRKFVIKKTRRPDGRVAFTQGGLSSAHSADQRVKISKLINGRTSLEDLQEDAEFQEALDKSESLRKRFNSVVDTFQKSRLSVIEKQEEIKAEVAAEFKAEGIDPAQALPVAGATNLFVIKGRKRDFFFKKDKKGNFVPASFTGRAPSLLDQAREAEAALGGGQSQVDQDAESLF